MRNTSTIYPSESANSMIINAINIETDPMTAITASNHPNECQPMGLPVATKSQPKPKNRSIDSQSRATKRPPSERRFKCDQCERMFFTRKDVKRHLVVHTGIRNFACPFCTQRFGRKDHLVRHAKKSHNRDTRSSTVKNHSIAAQHSSKSAVNGVPTLIEAKNNGISSVPSVAVGEPQLAHNQTKHTFNYQNNCQNNDQSSLVLLTNGSNNAINNSHTESGHNGNAHCGPYPHPHSHPLHPNPNQNHVMIAGMHANEPLCQYMSGVHPFDEMIAANAIKSETPPITAHHYFAFPVPPQTGLTYPLPNASFLPLVTTSSPGLNSCASSASVAAFGIPVSNVANATNPFSVDVNPSLPHFNQAFQ